MKTCIIYYSYEGHTKLIAETLSKTVGCECFEIKPVKDMKTKGLMKYVWGGRQALMKETPKLESIDFNIDDYDRIFLGTPIWSWTFAPTVRSFIKKHLSDKNIILFYTHEGGDQGFTHKAKELINQKNRCVEIRGFANIDKNKEASIADCKGWAKELKRKYRL